MAPERVVRRIGVYESMDGNENKVEEKLFEELPLDRVIGPLSSLEEVAQICGCKPEEIVVGKAAHLADAGDRTVFDDTVTGVNRWIRPDDSIDWPGIPEMERMMRHEQRVSGLRSNKGLSSLVSRCALVKFDVKSAHRTVKRKRRCWKYQIMRVRKSFWINKVGTYGVAVAAG